MYKGVITDLYITGLLAPIDLSHEKCRHFPKQNGGILDPRSHGSDHCPKLYLDLTSELQRDWNDICKPNFEAFVEADMQVIPSPP